MSRDWYDIQLNNDISISIWDVFGHLLSVSTSVKMVPLVPHQLPGVWSRRRWCFVSRRDWFAGALQLKRCQVKVQERKTTEDGTCVRCNLMRRCIIYLTDLNSMPFRQQQLSDLSRNCDKRSAVARLPAHTVCAGSLKNPQNIESACTIVMSTRQWHAQVVYSCFLFTMFIGRMSMKDEHLERNTYVKRHE